MASPKAPSSPSDLTSKYDSMPPDLLVKQCKKQIVLLQKLKGRCDQLQKKVANQSDYEELKEFKLKSEMDSTSYAEKMEKLTEEMISLKKRNSSLTENIECLKSKHETFQLSFQSLTEENDLLKREKVKSQAEAEEKYERELTRVNTQKVELEDKLTAANQHADDVRTKLEVNVESLNRSNMEVKEENEKMKEKLADVLVKLCGSLNITDKNVDKNNDVCLNLELAVDEVDERLKLADEDRSEMVRKLEEDIVSLTAKLEQSNMKDELVMKTTSGSDKLVEKLKSDIENLEVELRNVEESKKELVEINKVQNENIDKLQESVKKFETKEAKLVEMEEVEVMKNKIVSLTDELNAAKEKVKSNNQLLQLQVAADHQMAEETSAANSHLMLEIESLKKEMESSEKRFKDSNEEEVCRFEEKAEKSECEKNHLMKKVSELNEKINEFTSGNIKQQELLKSLKCDLGEKEEACKKMEERVVDLVECKEKVEKLNADLIDQLKLLKEKTKSLEIESAQEVTLVDDSSELQSKIENMKKSLAEKDKFNNKLKSLVLSKKKEIGLIKQQLNNLMEEKNVLMNKNNEFEKRWEESRSQANTVQIMQKEYDLLHDKLDLKHEEKTQIQKILDETSQDLSAKFKLVDELTIKVEELETRLNRSQSDKKELEKSLSSLNATFTTLQQEKEASAIEKTSLKQEITKLRDNSSELSTKLGLQETKLKEKEANLKQAQKAIQSSGMLSLEIKQFEDTVDGLKEEIKQLESTVESLNVDINSHEIRFVEVTKEKNVVEQLRSDAEERFNKMLKELECSKQEVEHLQEVEGELRIESDEFTKQLNNLQVNFDQKQLELSTKSHECQHLSDHLQTIEQENNKQVETFERDITNLKKRLNEIEEEKISIVTEYDSYKVRVHSVLKQQKVKETNQRSSTENKMEITKVLQNMELLQTSFNQSQSLLKTRENELDLLQKDYDMLLRQQQQLNDNSAEREKRWKNRVKLLQQEIVSMKKEHNDVIDRINKQHEETVTSSEDTLQEVRSLLKMVEDEKKKIIEEKDEEISKLQVRHHQMTSSQVSVDTTTTTTTTTGSVRKSMPVTSTPMHSRQSSSAHHYDVTHDDVIMMKREDGEGEENPQDHLSVMSFEQILEGPRINAVKLLSDTESISSEMAMKQLEGKLVVQSRRLQHLSEVARENESNSARLTDQNRVLKDEIRRLERNEVRKESLSNMEYLKNVIIKFIMLPPCDERTHLLPVLDTMLQLTQEEKNKLIVVAQGESIAETQKSWGGYFQRWSGV